MKKNIGTADRTIRLIIGTVLIVLAFTIVPQLWIKVVLIIGGLFSFYEALSSWCLFYQLIGKNTCPVE